MSNHFPKESIICGSNLKESKVKWITKHKHCVATSVHFLQFNTSTSVLKFTQCANYFMKTCILFILNYVWIIIHKIICYDKALWGVFRYIVTKADANPSGYTSVFSKGRSWTHRISAFPHLFFDTKKYFDDQERRCYLALGQVFCNKKLFRAFMQKY